MNNIVNIINEEIENNNNNSQLDGDFEWGKEKVAGNKIKPNRFVFHISEPKFRLKIHSNGLKLSVGESYKSWSGSKKAIPAVFATNSSFNEITGGVENFSGDVWVIDTNKINNEWFIDNHFNFMAKEYGNPHIVTFDNVNRNAIRLYYKVK